ncbi:hypothetical protein PG990_009074 [Apiospora arundinis]
MIYDKNDRYYLTAVARSRQEVINHAHALLYAFESFVSATSGMACQALEDLIEQIHVPLKREARVQLILEIVVPRLPGAYDTSELSTIDHSVRGCKAHESGKPITVAYNNSVAKLNKLIENIEKPKTVVLRLLGAYEMAELSTIDRLVRRYRGMKDLPGYKGMNLEKQVALYPEVKLLECMKDHPAYDAMIKGMRPERDPKVGDFHQSDDDAPTLQTWWSQVNDTTGKILKAPDGIMSSYPAYMEKMDDDAQTRNAPRGAGQRESK